MKNLLLLFVIPLFFISCVRDNNDNEQNNLVSFDVSMSIPSFGVYGTDKSANSQAAKSSTFEHIFKDEIDVVFTSTTSDFTATLTITPNDLSSSPSIELPYGTYSWTISTENDFTTDLEYSFPDFLPVYGTGTIEVFSSNISLDLIVDTNYGLVTVQKENITKATITLYEAISKQLTLLENLYYTYAYQQDAISITIEESKYGSTITEPAQGGKQILAKTHYNYILAFSDVDVNSITLKTAAFEQIDYYLQPTGTDSCTLSFDVYIDSWVSTQANGILTSTTSPSVEITPILYRLSSTCSSTTLIATITGLPEGLTMTYDSQNVATVSGTPSSQETGTYTYTLIGYNSNALASATSSVSVKGVISLTTSSTTTDNESSISLGQIGSLKFYNGNLFVGTHNKVLKVNNDGEISNYLGEGGEIDINIDISGESDFITGLAFDNNGVLYFGGDRTLRKLVNNQAVTIYNDGTCNYGIVVNSDNEVFISNCNAKKGIRKIDQSGNVTVFVGSNIGNPSGLAIKDNVIYVADNTGAFVYVVKLK